MSQPPSRRPPPQAQADASASAPDANAAAGATAPSAPAVVRRRSSLPNPADDASDLIVDWNHRHRASVIYGGEEDGDNDNDDEAEAGGNGNSRNARNANEEDTAAEQAQTGRPNLPTGGAIVDDPLPPRGSAPVPGRDANSSSSSSSSERQSLFDRIGALAAAATEHSSSTNLGPSSARAGTAAPSDPNRAEGPALPQPRANVAVSGASTSEQPEAAQQPTPPPTTNNRRTVRFQPHNRILVVEGRHHYTPQETSATWYDGEDATAMRQAYTSDVRSMRRRIRRNVSLDRHTHDVNGGNYSERGLEHLVSSDVYQERTDDQTGTIQAVLAAQENYLAEVRATRRARGVGQRPRRQGGDVSDDHDGNANGTAVGNDNDDSHADQLARMYGEMCLETRERAEELGRADAEEAALLLGATRDIEERRGGGGSRTGG